MDKVITRLYTGTDGESHFEDYRIPMMDVEGFFECTDPLNVTGIRFAGISSDKIINLHNLSHRVFIVTMFGELVIGTGHGIERVFKPGDIVLAEDITGRGHTLRKDSGGHHVAAYISLDETETRELEYFPDKTENGLQISRLYTGQDEESHYQDIIIPLLNYEDGLIALDHQFSDQDRSIPIKATSIVFGELYNDKQHDWQCVPHRQFVITLGGEVEWAVYDGTRRRFRTGEILFAEDTTGRGHKRKLISKENHKVAMITLDWDFESR